MYYYKVNNSEIVTKLLDMEQDNKKWSKLSDEIYKYMELTPSSNIRINTEVLEVCKVPDEFKSQFNKTMQNHGYHARKNSELNKKWLKCIEKFNLKYYDDIDFYIKIDINLFMDLISGNGMTVLTETKEIVMESLTKLDEKIKNIIEIDEVIYHNFL